MKILKFRGIQRSFKGSSSHLHMIYRVGLMIVPKIFEWKRPIYVSV